VAGLPGLFTLTGVLALGGVAVAIWWVPPEPAQHTASPKGSLKEVLTHVPSLRNNLGVFVLHAVMLAMWVAVPQMLVDAGLAKEHHWWVYLPAVSLGFLVMGKTLFPLERKGYLRAVFLSATLVIALVMFSLALVAGGTRCVVSGCHFVCVILRLQHFGSLPTQHRVPCRATPCTRRRHGFLQHLAVIGLFCRWRGRWRPHESRGCAGFIWGVRPGHLGLAFGCMVHGTH